MPKLVNLGSLCVDHVYRVAALVGAGETLASASHRVFPGGKGLNQSLAAARAGVEVLQFGCVGDDGQMLLEILRDAGVDTGGVRTLSAETSGHAVIQVNDRGENGIVIAGGTNRMLTDVDWQAALSSLESGDWLLLQNEINSLEEILGLAGDTPGRVAFNVAPVDGREQNYDLTSVDLLIVNEVEARALLGSATIERSDRAVAEALAVAHPGMDVVLTCGRNGLVYARGDDITHLPAFAVTAVDETAAGDAFIGYLLAELIAGETIADALRVGSAAGALAVTIAGAASSIPEQSAVRMLAEPPS